jgi:hypothetical protein
VVKKLKVTDLLPLGFEGSRTTVVNAVEEETPVRGIIMEILFS